MCGFCSNNQEELEKEKRHQKRVVADLRKMAYRIDQLIDGRIKPHSDNTKNMSYIARNIIRELVNEWM